MLQFTIEFYLNLTHFNIKNQSSIWIGYSKSQIRRIKQKTLSQACKGQAFPFSLCDEKYRFEYTIQ